MDSILELTKYVGEYSTSCTIVYFSLAKRRDGQLVSLWVRLLPCQLNCAVLEVGVRSMWRSIPSETLSNMEVQEERACYSPVAAPEFTRRENWGS